MLNQVNEPPRGLWGSKSGPMGWGEGEGATRAFLGNACMPKGPLLTGWSQRIGGVPPTQAPTGNTGPYLEMKAAQVRPEALTFPTSAPANSGFLIHVSQ